MLQKYLVYIILWFLSQLLIEINCQETPYVLKKRNEHTATLIDNKLYILGGSSINEVGKDFFYIDFSVSFNIQNLILTDLSNINIIPSHFGAGSARGGANNDTLFICGGVGNISADKVELVYTFNTQSSSWTTPVTTGVIPILFDASIGIIDYNGKMYFWDGIGDIIAILDTKNLIWETRSSIGAPNIGLKSTATLLPDNKIIYMDSSSSSLIQVYIYDTVNDTWSTKITSGIVPPKRLGASAVLGLDGQRVIIYGGSITESVDSLYELNLINSEWRIPKTSGQTPASREYHRANVIGNYMVITFGMFYQPPENDILLLDISNVNEYIWTNEFNPFPSSIVNTSASVPSDSPSQSVTSHNSNIVGIIIGSLVAGALLSFVGSYLYRWNKNRNNKNESNLNNNQATNNNQAERINYYPGQEIIQPRSSSSNY
ncbi:uncharacterized protein OCT59_011319 [Rhizophagus irregularis]|uniref:Kel2p n=2 Tax=Rhizophagus irregularis TaxID=588596 RepID=A0A015JPK5_RHIIW|nr:hypothetical protein GLOIN_2v1481978 [Rhizophagus irregularis DAOM 181602=DAOM 197198]EXX69140.1 Kel2p [Rhizophagus irregularis DAOM 197198w]POG66926.1 hypothetical protein GLOIN_2v1481978 [Rhizophagus irregularis DAOM 181602=DAOM 197198]UZO20058.1 hypothetical protein OCT59_011319 [Rhizophagus irregularis]GBC23768.2 hypothetical protein GLOIN_2v1481978 [Rhizophagus irregularis DAOM 181602=DAOM 197198]|eukprot:XP_025173792.1 hypothetical protein GLOIN_2v1481978 [Rhizophagus irregularis DAOM 181602=DAOM 197198]